jgi:transcription elongation factor GreA
MTPQGHETLIKEIETIKHVERPANIKAIEEARAHGDLSENADYDAAKNEQGLIQARLLQLEDILARAEVIDPSTLEGPTIMFGARVKLIDTETDEEISYQLVSSYEADVKRNMISIESPIGKALIGKEEGDEVLVTTPSGKRNFAVTSVRYKA